VAEQGHKDDSDQGREPKGHNGGHLEPPGQPPGPAKAGQRHVAKSGAEFLPWNPPAIKVDTWRRRPSLVVAEGVQGVGSSAEISIAAAPGQAKNTRKTGKLKLTRTAAQDPPPPRRAGDPAGRTRGLDAGPRAVLPSSEIGARRRSHKPGFFAGTPAGPAGRPRVCDLSVGSPARTHYAAHRFDGRHRVGQNGTGGGHHSAHVCLVAGRVTGAGASRSPQCQRRRGPAGSARRVRGFR
jgi:hypothetical protein